MEQQEFWEGGSFRHGVGTPAGTDSNYWALGTGTVTGTGVPWPWCQCYKYSGVGHKI